MRFQFIPALLLLGTLTASAQLTWDKTLQEFHPDITATQTVAVYTYTNSGKTPVTIVSATPSCHCTVATVSKTIVAPGEKGQITATMTYGDQIGYEEKTITVLTADLPPQQTDLALHVYVPEVIKVEPKQLSWTVGDKPTPQVIKVTINYPKPFNIIEVASTHENLFPQLKVIEPGKEYQITVTPKDMTQPAVATLAIRTDLPDKPMIHLISSAEIKAK